MKYSIGPREQPFVEGLAAEDDMIEVRVQRSIVQGEQMLYLDVNGITIVRIGGIKQRVELTQKPKE